MYKSIFMSHLRYTLRHKTEIKGEKMADFLPLSRFKADGNNVRF